MSTLTVLILFYMHVQCFLNMKNSITFTLLSINKQQERSMPGIQADTFFNLISNKT